MDCGACKTGGRGNEIVLQMDHCYFFMTTSSKHNFCNAHSHSLIFRISQQQYCLILLKNKRFLIINIIKSQCLIISRWNTFAEMATFWRNLVFSQIIFLNMFFKHVWFIVIDSIFSHMHYDCNLVCNLYTLVYKKS